MARRTTHPKGCLNEPVYLAQVLQTNHMVANDRPQELAAALQQMVGVP